jgi:hypothetical protein
MTDNVQLQKLEEVNEGFKPLGDWANKPAVPATNVTATNSSGHDMFVEVAANGATITAVKVDGVTVGARVSGIFFVRAGSTIALVYTVATPTWQWFYA